MNKNFLIAVKSCRRDCGNGANQAIRDTWGKGIASFFIGGASNFGLKHDEFALPCPDDYESLPQKTRAILRFALFDFDHYFLCDTDTFVIPEKLFASGFEQYDLTGHIGGNTENGRFHSWPSGGCGYWLSRKAAHIVLSTENLDWAEDRMVGQILAPYIGRGELSAKHDPGYGDGTITEHFCARGMHRQYDPKWMLERYRMGK